MNPARRTATVAVLALVALAAGLPLTAQASPGCAAIDGITGRLEAVGESLLPYGSFDAGDYISVQYAGTASGNFWFSLIGENEQHESATLPGTVGVRVSIPAGLVYAVDLYLSPGASAALDYRVSCRPAAP